jgi:hypothetical protein
VDGFFIRVADDDDCHFSVSKPRTLFVLGLVEPSAGWVEEAQADPSEFTLRGTDMVRKSCTRCVDEHFTFGAAADAGSMFVFGAVWIELQLAVCFVG